MSKTRQKIRKPAVTPLTPQQDFLTSFADPATLIDQIERESTGMPPGDAYRARVEELMPAQLAEAGDIDDAGDAEHLRHTTGGSTLEQAARRVGFILGFEYCCALRAQALVSGKTWFRKSGAR